MATIVDVAKEAQVSVATVSRVLNNNISVSDEKVERVMAAIEKLNFSYNRRVKPRKSSVRYLVIIALILKEELVRSIVAQAEENGLTPLIRYQLDFEEPLGNIMEPIKPMMEMVEGLVLIDIPHTEEEIGRIGKPVVSFGEMEKVKGAHAIQTDNIKAAREIVEHLVQQGRRHIALITADKRVPRAFHIFKDRSTGYISALINNQIPYDPEYVEESEFSCEGGYQAARRLMKKRLDIDAIFCISDQIAAGCLRALHDMGVPVPDGIAVAAFDDDSYSRVFVPSITTVEQKYHEIGVEIVRLILNFDREMEEMPGGRHLLVGYEIHLRESSVPDKDRATHRDHTRERS